MVRPRLLCRQRLIKQLSKLFERMGTTNLDATPTLVGEMPESIEKERII